MIAYFTMETSEFRDYSIKSIQFGVRFLMIICVVAILIIMSNMEVVQIKRALL